MFKAVALALALIAGSDALQLHTAASGTYRLIQQSTLRISLKSKRPPMPSSEGECPVSTAILLPMESRMESISSSSTLAPRLPSR